MAAFNPARQRFGRRVTVTLTDTANPVPIKVIDGYDGQLGGVRISFRVECRITPVADTATVRIYNLSPASRGALAQRSLAFVRRAPVRYVQIEAGYEQSMGIIFKGALLRCFNKREGPDWITEMELNTSFGQALLNDVQQSWTSPVGVPVRRILVELFTKAGFRDVKFSPTAERVLAGVVRVEYVASKSALEEAKRLLDSITEAKLTLSIDLNTVIIMEIGAPKDGSILVLSESSGLVGSPKVKDMGVEFRSLLDPRLRPGQLVELHSQTLKESLINSSIGSGLVLWGVTYSGDTHGNDWYCDADSWFFPPLFESALVGGIGAPR